MKKYLIKFLKNKYKLLFKALNYSNKSNLKIESLNLIIKKNTYVGKKNEKLVLPLDEIITPRIFRYEKWDYFIIKFIEKNLKLEDNYFIDIGANIGLISKQLQNRNLNIKKYFCFEPELNTFEILKKNLKNSRTIFFNFGLGVKEKKTKLYLNNSNKSDFSLFYKKNKKYYL